MKKLEQRDLQIGDILVYEDFDFDVEKLWDAYWKKGFEGVFDYMLHYLIAWFDPGKDGAHYKNIYHAGIWGNVDLNRGKSTKVNYQNGVIEAGEGGVMYDTLQSSRAHSRVMNIYVYRFKEKDANFERNITNHTRDFFNFKGEYSDETAWTLAVLCSLRYTKGALHQFLLQYLKYEWTTKWVVSKILEYINKYQDLHQREMIACSPLVAMIYKNAGYELPVTVFESLLDKIHPKPQFDLQELEEEIKKSEGKLLTAKNDNWNPIKETLVTPRQLMESPDVEFVGVLPHIATPKK